MEEKSQLADLEKSLLTDLEKSLLTDSETDLETDGRYNGRNRWKLQSEKTYG